MQGKRVNATRAFLGKIYKYGISPVIFAAALFVGLVIVNYVVAIHTSYIDVTQNKTNTLSEKTTEFLKGIDFDVTFKVFYPQQYERGIRLLLDKYAALNNHFSFEYIDPLKNPTVAEDNEVSLPFTIIIEGRGTNTRINPPPPDRTHTEREITIALFRLVSDQNRTVCFTMGHGELDPDNPGQDGLSVVRDRLLEQNYLIEKINLLEAGAVPRHCTILLIAGPNLSFTVEEATMVEDYLNTGGSALIMQGPGIKSGLESMLAYNYRLSFGDNYIYETSNKLTTEQFGPVSPLCRAGGPHPITDDLPNQFFLMPFVRSIELTGLAGNIQVLPLLVSSENSWAESDLESARSLRLNRRPSREEAEQKGPVPVAVVTERVFELPDSLRTRQRENYNVRSAFFGNAICITNRIVTPFSANLNLFLHTVNWITFNEKIMEVTPNLVRFTPVELTRSHQKRLTLFTLFLLPVSIIAVGIVIWFRRR